MTIRITLRIRESVPDYDLDPGNMLAFGGGLCCLRTSSCLFVFVVVGINNCCLIVPCKSPPTGVFICPCSPSLKTLIPCVGPKHSNVLYPLCCAKRSIISYCNLQVSFLLTTITTVLCDADRERRAIAEETVEELNRCLDQLEYIQSSRSIGAVAVHKVSNCT